MVFGEQLTIDSENSMTKSSGCYLSRRSSALLAVLFLVVILATGLVVYRLAEPNSGCSDHQSTSSIDGGSDRSGVGGAPKAAKVSDVRLPGHLKPITYNVRLLPFIEEGNFTFDGRVQIELFAEASGDNVTVHVKDITIRHESLRLTEVESGRELAITNHIYDKEREFFIMKIGSGGVKKGNHYLIEISFVGQLNDKLAGFYRSSYKDNSKNGSNSSDVTKWLAVTQFQPTDARRAFPCLDEPALKAKFNVTLGRRENMRSVSNMPIDHTKPITGHPGYVWDIFQESVPMSTYLVAFLVSEFDMKEAETGVSKTKFSVWSRPQALAQAEYARKIGPEILNHFETFFKTEFPLPKQDMVAIPDFSAGAMENWGLITYRETAMLYEPKVSSEMNKQRVAVVVSHELAHQWFGNLVTPSWWTDLWLNEGFASYVEYLGVDHVEPEWKMLEQFIVEDLQSVMTTDALETSHPISIVVQNPDEIGQIFDKISYQKGATIIRMMNHYLTSDTLQNGLSNYLNKYKYRAASQDDLWKVLTEQAHKDKSLPQNITVKDIMDTWTLQMGYPVLYVKRDYTGKFATIQQSRFLLTTPNQSSSAAYLWWIPLTYTDQKTLNFQNTTTKQWMPTSEQMKFYDVPADDQWIIFNIQQTGYYKVNYDKRNWKMLIDQLIRDHLTITTTNRAQLIDDSLDLARSGQLDYNTALSILKYLAAEKEYIPWKAALNNLYYLNSQLQRTPVYGLFKKYILSIIGDRYRTIGFDDKPTDTHLDHYQRVIVISWACSMGHQDCVDQSKQLFARWMSQPNATLIPANIRSTVYCTAIAHGDQSEWDFAWQQYLNSNVAAEKKRLLRALGCSRQTWLLSRYLQWIVPPTDRVRLQDGTTVFSAVSNNVIGRYLAWNFLRDRWSALYSSYGGGVFQLSNLVGALKLGYNSRLELAELSRFAEQNRHTLGEAQREIQQAIEHCRASVDWMTANYATIDKWLQQNVA